MVPNNDTSSHHFWPSRLSDAGLIVLQVGVLAFIANRFTIEPALNLSSLYLVILAAWLIQLLLPVSWRVPGTLILSVGYLVILTGPWGALALTAYSLVLVLAATRIRRRWLQLSAVSGLILVPVIGLATRQAWATGYPLVVSTFGSMFMFRMLILLYDRPHLRERPRWDMDLAYFFMLPNLAMFLFPAVDYRTFVTSRKPEDTWRIWRKGTRWLALGMFHMLLYRITYSHLALPVQQVKDFTGFWHYATTNYMLIIRLAGIFHTAIGALCLMGFDLPIAFNNFFLANGFADWWRRINIYFRDFLLKVFYYPLFFKFRKLGNRRAIVLTTLILFMISWFLHTWQWFWIKGTFPLRASDALFWIGFGSLVTWNSVRDLKPAIKSKAQPSLRSAIIRTGQILAMFLAMSILWSLWSANSLQDWFSTLGKTRFVHLYDIPMLLGIVAGAWLLAIIAQRMDDRLDLSRWFSPDPSGKMAMTWSMITLGSMVLFQIPAVTQILRHHTKIHVDQILSGSLNKEDEQLMVEGYYDEILVGNELTSPLGHVGGRKPEKLTQSGGKIFTGDFRHIALQPNSRISFKGRPFRTNRFGMRDRDYPLQPKPGTIRVLVQGGSIVLGSGVSDDEVFENLLEDTLNAGHPPHPYEFLNFGCSSYDLIDYAVQFQSDSLFRYQPDYLFVFSHGIDVEKALRDIARNVKGGTQMPYPFLDEAVKMAGLRPDMTVDQMDEALQPLGWSIVRQAYALLFQMALDHGIEPVWVYWPTVSALDAHQEEKTEVARMVREIGYKVIDLTGIYAGYPETDLQVDIFDKHPNSLGHRLAASQLIKILSRDFPLHDRTD